MLKELYASLIAESTDVPLIIQGFIPNWLLGDMYKVGPSQYQVGNSTYRHWFDALGMIHKLSFRNGEVKYSNKMLQSQTYKMSMKEKEICTTEFGTPAFPNLSRFSLKGFWNSIGILDQTDNCNVNVSMIGGNLIAMSETRKILKLNPLTLSTEKQLQMAQDISGITSTAHPFCAQDGNTVYNFYKQYGYKCWYNFFVSTLQGDKSKSRILTSIQVSRPSYIHSFGMSNSYLILAEFPMRANPLNFLTARLCAKAYIDNFNWNQQEKTIFSVIDKDTGNVITTAQAPSFFSFHHVNAFEQDGHVYVDMSCYEDASIIEALYVSKITDTNVKFPKSQVRRYKIRVSTDDKSEVDYSVIYPDTLELPVINEGKRGQAYRYIYGCGTSSQNSFLDQIVKVDLSKNFVRKWYQRGCFPSEPQFVAETGVSSEIEEDRGVLISLVTDVLNKKSFMLLLDAQSLAELARADLPHQVPPLLHGTFVYSAQKE